MLIPQLIAFSSWVHIFSQYLQVGAPLVKTRNKKINKINPFKEMYEVILPSADEQLKLDIKPELVLQHFE